MVFSSMSVVVVDQQRRRLLFSGKATSLRRCGRILVWRTEAASPPAN